LRAVAPTMDAPVKIGEIPFEILGVRTPRSAVDPGAGSALESLEGAPKSADRDVMKERGEPRFPIPCCHLAHASEPTWHTFIPALSPARVGLRRVPLGRAPSLHRLRGRRGRVLV